MSKHLAAISIITRLSCWSCVSAQNVAAQNIDRTNNPYASDKPLSEPVIFAEGIVSTGDFDSHPAFTTDGKTLYFLRSTPNFSLWTILVSRFEKGKWSTPGVAPFSGQYSDADPFITSDGSRFYFISNRPVAGKSMPDLDIWVMEKTAVGWSEPKNVGAPINSTSSEWYPTVTANGTIYSDQIVKVEKVERTFTVRVSLTASTPRRRIWATRSNTQFNEFQPLIAPDESFLIFMSGGRADGRGALTFLLATTVMARGQSPPILATKSIQAAMSFRQLFRRMANTFFGQTREALRISH